MDIDIEYIIIVYLDKRGLQYCLCLLAHGPMQSNLN